MSQPTHPLKGRLESDLRDAIKARQPVLTSTLRMVLTAVRNAEVSGKQARELSDDEVLAVLIKEAKKRREAAEAYTQAGRQDLADKELAEEEALAAYLPKQLSDDELSGLVRETLTEQGLSGMQSMGAVMKAVQTKVAGRADGRKVADEVRRQLTA